MGYSHVAHHRTRFDSSGVFGEQKTRGSPDHLEAAVPAEAAGPTVNPDQLGDADPQLSNTLLTVGVMALAG